MSLRFTILGCGSSGGVPRPALGWGDCDKPYMFGRRPRAVTPFPFTPIQLAHLLALRGRVADGLAAHVGDRSARAEVDPPGPVDALKALL